MHLRLARFFFFLLSFLPFISHAQQDVDFHVNAHLFLGKKILKVKRDFFDPYLWVLAQNNEVYRINSVTQAVDDFTQTFAAYNNLQFVDIAGQSKDTVFIATRSTNLIQYKSGAIRLIGSADGINSTLNSIGFAKPSVGGGASHILLIGADEGFFEYGTIGDPPVNPVHDRISKIYETTYRRQLYKDSAQNYTGPTTDTVQYMPVAIVGESITFVEQVWEGGKQFGFNVNSVYKIAASIYGYEFLEVYNDLFWGNNRGLFQRNSAFTFKSPFPYGHYLDGINVNKITSMYGLVAFGDGHWKADGRFIKEYMLVGTSQGLYFSSSVYNQFDSVNGVNNGLHKVSFFHYDELGGIVINDISVNASSITEPICENGAWVAADNGLYYIKPDYTKFLNSHTFNAINFKDQASSISSNKVCQGNNVIAVMNIPDNKGNTYQWYKDALALPGEDKTSLTINATGNYYLVVFDPCENIRAESNHLQVDVTPGPVFSFNYPDKIQQCDNSPYTLQTELNPGYQYRWYTNGVLNGETSEKFAVTQSGKYKVEVSACDAGWVSSKEVEVDLLNATKLPLPEISADKATYCAGDVAKLSVNVTTDAAYTINWYLDGSLIAADNDLTAISATTAGNYAVVITSKLATCSQPSQPYKLSFTPQPVFEPVSSAVLRSCNAIPLTVKFLGTMSVKYRWYVNGILNGNTTSDLLADKTGKYKVEASSCEGSWVSSGELQIDIVELPMPAITADKQAYCMGENAKLTITTAPGPSYTINWFRDNVALPANKNLSSLTTNAAGNYTVSVVNNDANSDGSFCSQLSAIQSLTFNAPPVVSIQKIVNTNLCFGQTIDLQASYTGGIVKWSTGESTGKISVSASGTYKATVTTAAGCQAETSIEVKLLPNPVFNIPDTNICTAKQQVITLTAPAGFAAYSWNGQTGTQTYQVSTAQTVSLTVTDINGCQATKTVKVLAQCPEIWIPNTFTPNGDGINDTWAIAGVNNDPAVLIKVYNRYGTLVYESKGYSTAWNGEYRGKKLPTGTYYYMVTTKNGKQNFNGPVTIIY